jgi:hypothetical protein
MATKKTGVVAKQPEMTASEKAESQAIVALLPSANAAAVVVEYGKTFGEQDVSALIEQLRSKFDQVKSGDLGQCESMLVGQAVALQSIFVNLARRAARQEYLKQHETFLRLALKAQNQSRMTLETLAEIKNPPVVFAKQANIAHGHQQVNNGASTPVSHAEKNITQQNELLEVQNGSTILDTRATGTAAAVDTAMATLGEVNRP